MRLKSLQVKGFKSFANETVLHFHEDVIGIVGPNGSGKSNIVDAVRWVLGEQKSKELRLESMGDVIFNGTKSKKEAPSATVALTFENTKGILPLEYQFITISRTLYRSGESEYRLNNVVCRLKDITSLFLDTGIGSNSYAIIALGMVDDILENKENARRRMFEQAAGVSKYKVRKRETLLKLKNTEEDLNRIEDLLFEIDGNLKSLEKQAKRTQKFNEIKQRYKELSIQHAVYAIQSLKEKYKETAETLHVQQDIYREHDTRLVQLQARLEKEKKQNLDKEVALNVKQKKMNELVSELRSLENEKVLLQQKADFTVKVMETIKNTRKENEKEIQDLKDEVVRLAERVEEEKKTGVTYTQSLEQSKLFHHDLKEKFLTVKSEFDDKQKRLLSLDKSINEFEKEIAILGNSQENLNFEKERINDDLGNARKNIEHIRTDYDQLGIAIQQKKKELDRWQVSEDERLSKLESNESAQVQIREKIAVINRVIDSKQNEFDLLKSMIDNFEGYPESIRFLHENWQKNPVILGDLLDVEESGKAVIESYLEQYLNHFVVDRLEEAFRGVQLLGEAQRGKANFFILDQFKTSPDKVSHPAALVPAIRMVRIESKYKALLDFLLKDCFIYDGQAEDLSSISGVNPDWVILSKHGHFIKTRFTVSGGSVGLFEGKKIGRKKNLDHLAKDIQKQIVQKQALEKELQDLVNKNLDLKQDQSKPRMTALTQELSELNQRFVKSQVQLDSLFKDEVDYKARLDEIQAQLIKNLTLREEKSGLLAQVVTEKELAQSTGEWGEGEMSGMSEALAKASEKMNQDQIQFIRHQNLLENLQKELGYKNDRIRDYSTKIENDSYRLLGEEKIAIDIKDSLERIEVSLLKFYEEKKAYHASLSESEQAFFQMKNSISELENNIRELLKSQNHLQNHIQQLKDIFNELKFNISGVGERLKIEFNIPVNDIINQEPDPTIQYEELTDEIEKLKTKISNYGDINPLALEAYQEMNERYQKILFQKNDIVTAKESLLQTISEIDQTATSQFYESFGKIRENFISVFRELFTNDDTCDLILEDPSNPLETEIEIIAKPKGKQPKSISQLSGGEKTLTATALLFALYLLKPAPFCIFDEVDAPLDDANIQKFNKIIQKFSKESQFIIVTHNKSTMVEVDVLYGVYMQEPGISSVSAVDFKKLQPEQVETS